MAFPSVTNNSGTNGTTATSAPVINIPSGVLADETIIVLFRISGLGAIGWPADWVEMVEDSSDDSVDGVTAIAWKKAVGGEGSITLSSGNGKFAAQALRITGAADP